MLSARIEIYSLIDEQPTAVRSPFRPQDYLSGSMLGGPQECARTTMCFLSRCYASRVSGLSSQSFILHRAYKHSQKEADNSLTLEHDDPEALDELLKYFYTLSDHINVRPLRNKNWGVYRCPSNHDKHLEGLSNEVRYLAGVLIIAEKYCVSDLVTLAGGKIEERLSILELRPHFLQADQPANLVFAWAGALYFEDEIPGLHKYQTLFSKIFTSDFDDTTDKLDIEGVIRAHPKLGWDLLTHTRKLLQKHEKTAKSQEKKIQDMHYWLPKAKKRQFE